MRNPFTYYFAVNTGFIQTRLCIIGFTFSSVALIKKMSFDSRTTMRHMSVIEAIIVRINAMNNHGTVGVYRTNYESMSIKLLRLIFITGINNTWWQRNVFLGSRNGEALDNYQSTLHFSSFQVFASVLWPPVYCLRSLSALSSTWYPAAGQQLFSVGALW